MTLLLVATIEIEIEPLDADAVLNRLGVDRHCVEKRLYGPGEYVSADAWRPGPWQGGRSRSRVKPRAERLRLLRREVGDEEDWSDTKIL